MQEFNVGDVILVKVTGITKYGIFVSIDDKYVGLIHISEISHRYVTSIKSVVKLKELILARVIKIDGDKINLSIKDLNYKVKKSCLKLKEPKLRVDASEFNVLKKKLQNWIDNF